MHEKFVLVGIGETHRREQRQIEKLLYCGGEAPGRRDGRTVLFRKVS
jgi:hypothetical protein